MNRWQYNTKLNEFKDNKNLLNVSGLVLELLKDYFRINSQQFKYIDNDPVKSKILLDLHQQFNPEDCENYPGVYVKRETYIFRSKGKTISDVNNYLYSATGSEFIITNSCGFSLLVVGKEHGELELLANEVALFLTVFRLPILQYLDFLDILVQAVSDVQLLQEDKNYKVATVNLLTEFNFSWVLNTENPVIDKQGININVCDSNT